MTVERLARALAHAYGLVLDRADRIDFGIWEESFSIWTDQGRLFAKRFLRKARKTDDMLRGLRLSESLRAQGFPAPRVIPAHTGDLIAFVESERYQVTEWVDGECYHPGDLPLRCATPMGALLGRFHRLSGSQASTSYTFAGRNTALAQCRQALERYREHAEPFARVAEAVLEEQIALLQTLPADFHERLPVPGRRGPCFNSFWVEQLLFHREGQVAALVDWTDGAGRVGFWVDDLDTGLHLSALGVDAIARFVAGYQSENPLPETEWRALSAVLCYGHLASTNFLSGWFDRPYRRMQDWEQTAERWHRLVPVRFRRYPEIEAAVLQAAGR
ncbi:MAG TPA: phosphotransferase [Symbiobacteriaceae bacterium]|jgi:Ser/Thr protein kinase RdoA (MazF antagonist)